MTATCEHRIEFVEATHTYLVDGIETPSVTQILEAAGISDFSMVPREVLEFAAARGTAVHKAAWYDDQGQLDPSSLDPRIAGYLEGWRAFRRDTGFTPRAIETQVYCPTYRYCGTFDREGELKPAANSRTGRAAIVDIKTGEECASWPIQLAGYARTLPSPRSRDRVIVKLSADGAYRVIVYPHSDYARDEAIFLSACNLYHFRHSKGLI